MTYMQLLRFCAGLSEEQLKRPVLVRGDNGRSSHYVECAKVFWDDLVDRDKGECEIFIGPSTR
jgi:hypothetical protein